jgi:hypothetical protein
METKGKTFEIKTIDQFLNVVNDENIDLILKDFIVFVHYINEVVKKAKEANPDLKDKLTSELMSSSFLWTDDGVNELKKVITTIKETGEKQEFEL